MTFFKERAFSFDIKIWILCAILPFFDFLRFLIRLVARRRLVRNWWTHVPRDKSSQFVGEKKREINSPESQLVSYRETGSFFPNLSSTTQEKDMYATRIATCITRVDTTIPLPSPHKGQEKKRDSGNTREEERATMGARESEGPGQVRQRKS